ncbi:MAG: integration host factor subunit alpha [Deltaproteobacteria bacterium]|nr:integration host factor subunit alpha [Deltaproteobacteria bacterium]
MILKKAGIVKSIHDQLGLPKNRSTDIFESVLEIIKQSLVKGEEVKISGFGKFYVIDKKARNGRNPHTGEHMIIEPRRIVSFRYSSRARRGLNG